jgi:hypothetical protein
MAGIKANSETMSSVMRGKASWSLQSGIHNALDKPCRHSMVNRQAMFPATARALIQRSRRTSPLQPV